jgi:hypothetical protein
VIKFGGHFGKELLRISEEKVASSLTAGAVETYICSVFYLRDYRTLFDTDGVEGGRTSKSPEDEIQEAKPLLPAIPEDFVRHLVLGEGTFGQVWLE